MDEPDKTEENESSPLLDKDGRKPTVHQQITRFLLVCLILFLHTVSAALHSPIMSQYVYSRYEEQYYGNVSVQHKKPNRCAVNTTSNNEGIQHRVQKAATDFVLHLTLASAIPSILSNLFLGFYSDHFGRKFIFVIAIAGRLIRDVTTNAVIKWDLNLNYFFIGYGTEGLSGMSYSFYLASYAYTADVTPPKKVRTLAIAVSELAKGIAEVAFQIATGYFIKDIGYFYPSVIMTSATFLDLVLVAFVLPETLKSRPQRCISPVESFKKVFGFYFINHKNRRRSFLWLGTIVFFILVVSSSGTSTISMVYKLSPPFCWDSVKIGIYSACETGAHLTASVIAIVLLQLCISDEFICVIGLLSGTGNCVLLALATTDVMLYLAPVVGICTSVSTPAIRSILSRMVSSAEQGAVFACMSVIDSICAAIGSIMFNNVYESTLDVMKGTVYLLMAGIHILAIGFMILFVLVKRRAVGSLGHGGLSIQEERRDYRKQN